MKNWNERPTEIANLFNPAFCATLLGYTARGFQAQRSSGLPWVVSFLVLPLILHKNTRALAPKTKATKFPAWVERNPSIRVGFAERARHFVPHVREAIIFGVSAQLLRLDGSSMLLPGRALPKLELATDSEEVRDCIRKARSIGAVLATAGSDHTLFALLGVRE